MRKTTKKGFTLMELIIVIALFSVIMVLVMSFIDPAAKLMTKTSTKEKTAAYVDNINEYVDKSLRYASFVRVFESDFRLKSSVTPVAEKDAVQEFIDDFFDGAITSTGAPLTGKVHVLKLLNEPDRDTLTASSTYDGVAGTDLKDGVLVDVVYDFKAGDSKPELDGLGKTIRVFDGTFKHAEITGPVSNALAVNPEHFRHYSYYYKLGYYEFIPVSDRTVIKGYPEAESGVYKSSLITKADGTSNLYKKTGGAIDIKGNNSLDFYYKELIPMRDNTGTEMQINAFSFAVTMVAYPNDSKGNNKVNCTKTVTDPTDSSTEDVPTSIFKSPCYMATSSMTMINTTTSVVNDSVLGLINTTAYMKDQEVGGAVKAGSDLLSVQAQDTAYSRYAASMPNPSQNTSNIFFIYIAPSEVNVG